MKIDIRSKTVTFRDNINIKIGDEFNFNIDKVHQTMILTEYLGNCKYKFKVKGYR